MYSATYKTLLSPRARGGDNSQELKMTIKSLQNDVSPKTFNATWRTHEDEERYKRERLECANKKDDRVRSMVQIFVQGLPDINEAELYCHALKYFSSVGPIKIDQETKQEKIWFYKDKNGKLKGECTITYSEHSVQAAALQKFNNKYFLGCKIKVEASIVKPHQATGKPLSKINILKRAPNGEKREQKIRETFLPSHSKFYHRTLEDEEKFEMERIKRANKKDDRVRSNVQIFVQGLPAMDESELYCQALKYFSSVGQIKIDKETKQEKIWFYKDKTGKLKGECTITYSDHETQAAALQKFNNQNFLGSQIKVEASIVKPHQANPHEMQKKDFLKDDPKTVKPINFNRRRCDVNVGHVHKPYKNHMKQNRNQYKTGNVIFRKNRNNYHYDHRDRHASTSLGSSTY